MRYVRILLLQVEHVLQERARSFVWFLLTLLGPLVFILFWYGASHGGGQVATGWSFSAIASYYFILPIAGAALMTHQEEEIAEIDIHDGSLVQYLMKPFSYYWYKFYEEIPYRMLQGFYAILTFAVFALLFKNLVVLTNDPEKLFLSVFVIILAFFLAFTFKMVVGILAFWMTDIGGLYELIDVVLIIFAGYLLPLELMNKSVERLATLLPFSSMIYFPIITLQGKLNPPEIILLIIRQIIWLAIFGLAYRFLWKHGVKKFSGVGQ